MVKLQKTFEVEEYSLRGFWPQVAERRWGRGERGEKKSPSKMGGESSEKRKTQLLQNLKVLFVPSLN